MNGKKLYRSESNRMLWGVCAGIIAAIIIPSESTRNNNMM